MTEREKRIEEMARDLCGETNYCACRNSWNCEQKVFASKAIDYVLRKEDEVQKETELKLKRLLLVLCNRQHNYYPSIDSYCVSEKVVKLDDIKEQFKKLGVEV